MKVAFDGRPAAAAYARAFRSFRELPGFDHKAILRAEMASILKAWAGKTKVATKQQADYRARYRAGKRAFGLVGHIDRNPFGISVNTGLRGGRAGEVWYRHPRSKKFQQAGLVRDNGTFTASWIHWRSAVWQGIRTGAEAYGDQLQRLLPLAQKSIGLARQSVIQIADEIGIDLAKVAGGGISEAGIAKARSAIASNGQSYRNGYGTDGGDEVRYYVQAISRLPFGAKIGMDRDLGGVLARRAKFIETSYAKGAFNSIQGVSRAFPNFTRFNSALSLS